MPASEAAQAVSKLSAAFAKELSQESAAVYVEKLSDIPSELLKRAVDSIIDSAEFFPVIAEIRREAARIAGLLPPTPSEALALIRRASISRPVYRRDGSFAYTDHEWDRDVLEQGGDAVHEALSRVGDPLDAEGKPHFGWDTGFAKTYDTVAAAEESRVLADLPKALAAANRKLLTAGDRG